MPPGGEGRIKISVDTSGHSGKIMAKAISVHTNDSQNSSVKLKISGSVEDIVNISPRTVRLSGTVSQYIEIAMTVKITPVEKYPFSITSLQLKDGINIMAHFKKSDLPTGSWDIKVSNIREKAGRYFDEITLTTDSTIVPEIKINVFGNITD
ncbi:MAG: hypothetical protein HQK67_04735 [Desulfamplus sp.]|nr:hypothetical protein [Desulfamplus sp.]